MEITEEKNAEHIRCFVESEVDRLAFQEKRLVYGIMGPKLKRKTIRRLLKHADGSFERVVASFEMLLRCKSIASYVRCLEELPAALGQYQDNHT